MEGGCAVDGRGLSGSVGWIGKEECLSIGRLMEWRSDLEQIIIH